MDKTQIAVDLFNDFAQAYQEKFMDVEAYQETFDLFCQHIAQQGAEILEIACGPGNITKVLLEKRPDFRILATDLAPNMLELAKANSPEAEFQLMDARDVGKVGKKYDGIMCGFCLPYLTKEEAIQFIGDAATVLKPGGVLYLSTMEDDYNKSGFKSSSTNPERGAYMHYHEANYLTAALTENGFRIIDLRRQDYLTGTEPMVDLLILAGK